MAWLVRAGETQMGPMEMEALVGWARAGRLQPTDVLWTQGMAAWKPAGQFPELAAAFAAAPPPAAARLGDDPAMRLLLPVGRSGWAIAAGYLGLFSLLVLPAPLALFTGLMAVRDIRRNPKLHGMGRAVLGIVLGAIGTTVLAVLLFATYKRTANG
jgi:hypothetical protein